MELGNQLNYRKSITTGMGTFFSVDVNDVYRPLGIDLRKPVALKDGFSEAFNKKFEIKTGVTKHDLATSNLHKYEHCYVPIDAKYISCKFSVRFEANSISPERSQLSETVQTLEEFSDLYNKAKGYNYLAKRYLKSIYSGIWLWRNQQTLNTCLTINSTEGLQLIIRDVHSRRYSDDWNEYQVQIDHIAESIESAFIDPSKYFGLEVEGKLTVQPGMPIYPSQAFIEKEHKKSKVLQSTTINGLRTAIFSADKIGAAIALIDDWFPDADHPIRVGSYAADKNRNTCYRHPDSGLDLYTLLKSIEKVIDQLEKFNTSGVVPVEAHFIMANLIKGGLFQRGGKNE